MPRLKSILYRDNQKSVLETFDCCQFLHTTNEHFTGIIPLKYLYNHKDISENQEIPLKFLDAIIADLKREGLLVNYSGKRSGYILARPACEISVYDIFRAFEPELTIVNCTCPTNECERVNICPATDYWFDLNNEIKSKRSKY